MSLETKLNELAAAIGGDIKQLQINDGDLTALSTTVKTSLVNAINEVFSLASSGASVIDDSAGAGMTDKTWSADKLASEFAVAVSSLVDTAPATLDTLNEIAQALNDDPNFATTISTELGNRVRYDAAQTLSVAQQLQACENIGVGNPEADLLSIYTTARDA